MKVAGLARAAAIVFLLGIVGAVVGWVWFRPRPIVVSAGRFPEELVYVRADDDVIDGGAFFAPPKNVAKPIAVIWVHGWGVNFYYPTYTMIGRHLAEHGVATLVVNTRMHDIGTVAAYRFGRRVRGGGYWGIPSEETRDVAAWIRLAERRGFSKVVLAGHSAGWAPVVRYQATSRDPRVAGLILASGAVQPLHPERDEELLRQATRLLADGRGEDLIRLPNRSFPSFISAANFLDQANTPREFLDFFGLAGKDAAISRVTCPLLAFFGTNGDVGGQADLEAVRSSTKRLTTGPSRIDTALIERADHMYTGEEEQVARVIAEWVDRARLAASPAR
jgi:pimeloyl-ACP methyl ester carboxylesterase